jgi:hypothetical protein
MNAMITSTDRERLRELARRVADIAALPVQAERVREWKRHNDLGPGRPMILVFPEGAWRELLPDGALTCEGDEARAYEWELLRRIYEHEHFDCDNVVSDVIEVKKTIHVGGTGLSARWRRPDMAHGARGFDPVLYDRHGLEKLHAPTVAYDEAKSLADLATAAEVFGDILKVRLVGVSHVSFHLMAEYTELRGLEPMMEDLIEQPELVHDAMARLTAIHEATLAQYVRLGLLSANSNGTYHSSGGVGFTDTLEAKGFDPDRVRPADMWASAESQELALVSPAMHAEFALAYEKRLLSPFARAGYGCCESLTNKLGDVLAVPNMWRVSISPFADVDVGAAELGARAIFSWKPHPAHLVGVFDEDRVRTYLRHTCEVAKAEGCVLEMILKDTHTCESRPERFTAWTRIAREVVRDVLS